MSPYFGAYLLSSSNKGSVVQSIISLTKPLASDSLVKSNAFIHFGDKVWQYYYFFVDKVRGTFAVQKIVTLYRQKSRSIFAYNMFEIATSR